VSLRRPFTVCAALSNRLNILVLAFVALILVTGGAVRLTGSGLGCSDWPDCSVGHLTPALHIHPLIEFSNRMVTDVLIVLVAAAFVAALFRRPHRRDLVYLSGGLVAGILVQAVVGGIVVLTKLNPYWVMVDLFATMDQAPRARCRRHRDPRRQDSGLGDGVVLGPCGDHHDGLSG
jgi:cytochrome c oxidase assembly protein subunit 15